MTSVLVVTKVVTGWAIVSITVCENEVKADCAPVSVAIMVLVAATLCPGVILPDGNTGDKSCGLLFILCMFMCIIFSNRHQNS